MTIAIRKPSARFCALLLGLVAAGCGSEPTAPPALALEQCAVPGVEEPLLCGHLAVPENRAKPGRDITLNVVVVPATGRKTLPPLYDLAGGPGIPAAGGANFWATAGSIHRTHRDIVLVDQRGTGGSAPLPCPLSFSNPLAPVLDLDTVRACRERLAASADLSQYSTAAAAQDLEAVRAALGHEHIDLSGLSYGTRVEQEYLRAYPDRVRAMVLLGTVSPEEKQPLSFSHNAQVILDRLVRQCDEDTACHNAIPGLAHDIATLQRKFAAGTVPATLDDGRNVALEGGPFWEAVRGLLITTDSQRRLPWLLHQASRGQLVLPAKERPDFGDNGLLLSVSCPEDTLRITDDEIAAAGDTVFGTYRLRRQIAACRAWGVPALEAPHPGFVESAVPVLLLAGEMDHVTPVQAAQEVAAHLPNARVVVVPYLGHFPDGLSHMECYDQIINQFFVAGGAVGLDLDCMKTMQPPSFQTVEPREVARDVF